MAMSQITSDEFVPTVQIEGVQTVLPTLATDPREICLVSVKDPMGSDVFRGCLNVVLYYNKAVEEDSGWVVAGWIKESLGRALTDQPMLSGRLRRGIDGNGELEMVSNDSGVRLVEAKITMTLQEFLGLEEREKLEGDRLVFWKHIDEQNPQFSPLLYVQVTNFQCGGYSIGISSSLILVDLLIVENFLMRWASIQKNLLSKYDALKMPIFYLPNLKNTSLSPYNAIIPTPSKHSGQTMIFKIAGDSEIGGVKNDLCKKAASHCIAEAEHKLGGEISSGFSLFVKESPKVLRVQNCQKNELVKSHQNLISTQVTSSSLDDMGIKELAFHDGNKPAHVSSWIGSVVDGLVMAIPSPNENASSEVSLIVTIPEKSFK
ncbi:unnamed protein product [Dovyalis caffra]|uniref:Uncharacterized protein n=1 Tax=Dovyalis caffra TaxID=77055 RepID=A0AAV1SRG1_9ROSI|nr:unnamed protein product [Dovyalis caffra]